MLNYAAADYRACPSVGRNGATLKALSMLAIVGVALTVLCYEAAESHDVSRQLADSTSEPTKTAWPRYILGHSAGHSGTTTIQYAMTQPGCPWEYSTAAFERAAPGELTWPYDEDCSRTINELVPHIHYLRNILLIKKTKRDLHAVIELKDKTAFVDLGHIHNRGRTIECLAKHFGEEAAFIHIRRNRYDIARSFAHGSHQTPCKVDIHNYDVGRLGERRLHPLLATCPRSGENAGPVNLPVESDEVWDSMTPFQRFLWYTDEVEHRWHTLQKMFEGVQPSPKFYEITWNSGEELAVGAHQLREAMGCTPVQLVHKGNDGTNDKALECASLIKQDLEYRKLMKYTPETAELLFSTRYPQHVDIEECVESRDQLEWSIKTFSSEYGIEFNERQWVLRDASQSSLSLE